MSQDAVDLKEVLERVQNDRALLVELFDIFLSDCPGKITALKTAVAKKDLTALKDVAHSLKGASGNISAKKLFDSFLKIEQIAKSNDLSALDGPLSILDSQIEELKVFAAKYKDENKTS